MEISDLKAGQSLKRTAAGDIPVDWACAELKKICEISRTKPGGHDIPGSVYLDRQGGFHSSRPREKSSFRITAKRGLDIGWILACLSSEEMPGRLTKKNLMEIHLPIPPGAPFPAAGEALSGLEEKIRKTPAGAERERMESASAKLRRILLNRPPATRRARPPRRLRRGRPRGTSP